MALLIKTAINCARSTAQVKRLIVPQLYTAYSAFNYSSKSMAAMNEHEVVPDVIAVAPNEKIEVNLPNITLLQLIFVHFGILYYINI